MAFCAADPERYVRAQRTRKVIKNINRSAWNWIAFFFGPFWYLAKGMTSKGIWMLIICIFTLFAAYPFLMFYSGAKGESDLYEYQLMVRSRLNLDKI